MTKSTYVCRYFLFPTIWMMEDKFCCVNPEGKIQGCS